MRYTIHITKRKREEPEPLLPFPLSLNRRPPFLSLKRTKKKTLRVRTLLNVFHFSSSLFRNGGRAFHGGRPSQLHAGRLWGGRRRRKWQNYPQTPFFLFSRAFEPKYPGPRWASKPLPCKFFSKKNPLKVSFYGGTRTEFPPDSNDSACSLLFSGGLVFWLGPGLSRLGRVGLESVLLGGDSPESGRRLFIWRVRKSDVGAMAVSLLRMWSWAFSWPYLYEDGFGLWSPKYLNQCIG